MQPPPTPSALESGHELPVGYRLHEFEIVRVIGEGGFSIVYLVLDHQLHRHVALKEYIPAALAGRGAEQRITLLSDRHRDTFELGLRSFVNEARLLASFDHPSLIKVYRFWEQNGTAYMVMPYYAGPTLKAMLRQMPEPPDEAWLKRLLTPLLDALRTLHEGSCYHRDISPENILLLGPQLTPLLLDFGAARRVIGNAAPALTAFLKPGYAPIEQYSEMPSSRQGAWTDVYALCAVLYTAIAGRTPVASVARLMQDDLAPLAEVARGRYSPGFLSAIDRGLAVRPEDRLQDTAALRDELFAQPAPVSRHEAKTIVLPRLSEEVMPAADAAAVPVPVPAPAPAPPKATMPAPRVSSSVLRIGVALAAAVAVAGGASLALRNRPSPAPEVPLAASQPAPRSAFTVVGVLEDIVQRADPALAVSAVAEQASVRIGRDDIRITVKASEGGYLYVLFSGTGDPEIRLLYPNRRDTGNRVAANDVVVLPSPQSRLKMTASGPAGVDHVVAIVSRVPRQFDGVGLRNETSSAFDLARFDLARLEQLWREVPVGESPFAGAADCAPAQPCANGYGAALLRITEVGGS